MTEAQLKKLDDAVTLQCDIGTCNERLEALKADLIREARSHKEDFTIIEGGGSPALRFGKFVAFPRFIHAWSCSSDHGEVDRAYSRWRLHLPATRLSRLD